MANNPIIHNDGGVFRFQDYLSQIPGFLKDEDDVVVLLQLFSDYINNAYRNITTVTQFEFKLITTESRINPTILQLQKLNDLLKLSNERSLPLLYLSKPISNPISSKNFFLGIFDYGGKLESLDPSIIDPIPKKDGDRIYVRFTDPTQFIHTGVYVYNTEGNNLTLDPFSSSQDPFLNTPNEPLETVGGLAPRMLEFNVSNITDVSVRKIKTVDTTIYFEVYFTANIESLKNIESIIPKSVDLDEDGTTDYNYLIDYYDAVETLPSTYKHKHFVKFAPQCDSMDWTNTEEVGKGVFYSRELTQFGRDKFIKEKTKKNVYIDPLFDDNTTTLEIETIQGDGAGLIRVKTRFPHALCAGEDINIEGISTYDVQNVTITKIFNKVEFEYFDDSNSSVAEEVAGTVLISDLFFNKNINDSEKFSLKIPYKNLEGLIEFQIGDRVSRIVPVDREIVNKFLGENVNTDSHFIIADFNFFSGDWSIGDKVTVRSNQDFVGTITFPTGLTEGELYEISDFPPLGGAVKLKDVELSALGDGRIDIVRLNRYFDADTDVNLSENTIRIHHIYEDREENPIDPVADLKVGDFFQLGGERLGVIELPEPLEENVTYRIFEVDTENKTIKLTLDQVTEVDLTTPAGSGIIDFILMRTSRKNSAVVTNVEISVPNEEGILTVAPHAGDLISRGVIAKISEKTAQFIADIDSTSVPWSERLAMYKKGDFVTYENIRYQLLTSVETVQIDQRPDVNKDYSRAMFDISIPDKIILENPYMFGMYRVKSLGFEEEPDFNAGFAELSQDLYIQQVDDLTLKYGHDQREWIFNARFAPKTITSRNGFLEIIQNSHDFTFDAVDGTVDPFIKTQTGTIKDGQLVFSEDEFALLLEGLELTLVRPISLTYNPTENLVTAKVDVDAEGDHRLKTGVRVVISGADQVDYNGAFPITVIDSETFTYAPLDVPTFSPATGSPEFKFENTVIHKVAEMSVESGTTIKVKTKEDHGFREGISVKVSGATDPEYNRTYENITIITNKIFEAEVPTTSPFTLSPDPSELAIVEYQPIDGDYIRVGNQPASNQNRIYIAREDGWVIYDDSKILENTTLYTRQNLFDITDNNPEIAKGDTFGIMSLHRTGDEVTVVLFEEHDYREGTIVNIENINSSEYNGRFEIFEIINETSFKYRLAADAEPNTPGSPIKNKMMLCTSDRWYKFDVKQIQWQKKSNGLTFNSGENNSEYTIEPATLTDKFINNVSPLFGEVTFTYFTSLTTSEVIKFKVGDIVNLEDQFITSEGSVDIPVKYRVTKGKWQILDTKLVAKTREVVVAAVESQEQSLSDDDPLIYTTFNDDQVEDDINENFSGNQQLFKVDNLYAANFQYVFEKIDNVDTISSYHRNYNANQDKNSVVLDRSDMNEDFIGVPDMDYPMVEKIERLAYLKDPNVIDFEFISNLGRYMGYDITLLIDDITKSTFYKTQKEIEMAVRKAIQNLPQFYTLKSTKSGLEAMMLAFGIVGKVVTLWTEANSQYENFTPDYQVRNLQYTRMIETGQSLNMVSTPHFNVELDVDGNFDNQLLGNEIKNLISNIKRYKPINTVFDDLVAFISFSGNASIQMGEISSQGCMTFDVGFDDLEFDFGSVINNDCI